MHNLYKMSSFLWFTLLFCSAIITCNISEGKEQVDDNDFAEFELFDDEDDTTAAKSDKIFVDDAEADVKESRESQLKEEVISDDEDEAVVEDEESDDELSHFNDDEEFVGFDGERQPGRAMKGEPKITIAKRQDMIGVISQLIRPNSDQLIIRVTLDEMDPYVFMFGNKKSVTKLAKDMADITTYCPEKKAADKYGFGSQYMLMSELGEAAAAVLSDSKVAAILNKFPTVVDYFHFSDQYSGVKPPEDAQQTKLPDVQKMLVFCFNFLGRGRTTVESMEGMKPLLQLVFHLAEKMRRFKLSKEAKSKAERNRQRVEEAFMKATHGVRAEMAQVKREEKKRQERERILEIDDPEKQRKWEEREQRRELKRRAPKMKQLKVKAM